MQAVLILLALIGLSSAGVQVLTPEILRNLQQIQPAARQQTKSTNLQQYLAQARQAVILREEDTPLEFPDLYVHDFDTSNGIRHRQSGALVNPGKKEEALNVAGQYSYVGPDGKQYTVFYTADQNGFQSAGEHIPPAANTSKKPKLGISSGAIASLAGGGLG